MPGFSPLALLFCFLPKEKIFILQGRIIEFRNFSPPFLYFFSHSAAVRPILFSKRKLSWHKVCLL